MAAEDYVGPPGKEKKFHQTHFSAPGVKLKGKSYYKLVRIGLGRYKFVRKVDNAKQKES